MGSGRFVVRCGPRRCPAAGADCAPWGGVVVGGVGNEEMCVDAGEVDQGQEQRVFSGGVLAGLVYLAVDQLGELVVPGQQLFVLVLALPLLYQRRNAGHLRRRGVGIGFVAPGIGAAVQVVQAAEDQAGAVEAVAVAAVAQGFVKAVGSVEAEAVEAAVEDVFQGVRGGGVGLVGHDEARHFVYLRFVVLVSGWGTGTGRKDQPCGRSR